MNLNQHKSTIKGNKEILSIIYTDNAIHSDTVKDLENENLKLKQLLENNSIKTKELIKHNQRIISIIAHDLRAPYNSVLNLLDFLLKNYNSIDKQTLIDYLNILKVSTCDSLEMLDSMIHWSIINNYSRQVRPQIIELSPLIDKIFASHRYAIKENCIILKNNTPESFTILADINILETILRNLIDNAIQNNIKNGRVEVSVYSQNEYVDILVKDTGVGINENYLESFNDNPERTILYDTNKKWKGLGLQLIKELVELHEFEIQFMTNGSGTTVRLRIFSVK